MQVPFSLCRYLFPDTLTSYFATISNDKWILTKGYLIWEINASKKGNNEFAKFILPLFGTVASEALIERCFWYQKRILGDQSMNMSREVEQARLTLILSKKITFF